jgi:CRP-like cAMP-binding protein
VQPPLNDIIMDQVKEIYEGLVGHWFSEVLTKTEIIALFERSTIVEYRKRETVVKMGEFATHMVLLLEGFVKLEIQEGKRDFIIDIESGANFIGLPLMLTVEKHLFSIVTLTDATVIFVPVESLKQMLKTNFKFAQSIVDHGNNTFVIPLLDKLRSASQNNIRGRLAKQLIHLSTQVHRSPSFNLLVSRLEMAHMIGFSRENVIRVLAEFNSENIIAIDGKTIEILNLNRLEEMAKYS